MKFNLNSASTSALFCRAAATALLVLSSATSFAAGWQSDEENLHGYNNAIPDKSDAENNWKEDQISPPPAPLDKNLVPIDAGANARLSFFVDSTSISVGKDDVVRYVMVSRSSEGARNVAFEGIRCSTGEVRSLAFGQDNGSWTPSGSSPWRQITSNTANGFHATLRNEYFCSGGLIAGDQKKLTRYLTSPEPIDPTN